MLQFEKLKQQNFYLHTLWIVFSLNDHCNKLKGINQFKIYRFLQIPIILKNEILQNDPLFETAPYFPLEVKAPKGEAAQDSFFMQVNKKCLSPAAYCKGIVIRR